jgi:hypothetical protein
VLPLDALALVFLLFLFQDNLDKQLLEFLVAVVDAKLFKTNTKHAELTRSQEDNAKN